MGKLFTAKVGKLLTRILGNYLTEALGKVLDIYKKSNEMNLEYKNNRRTAIKWAFSLVYRLN